MVWVFGLAGLKAEAEAAYANYVPGPGLSRFAVLLALGRREEAMAALDNDPSRPAVYLDPICDPIRDDPRFKKFIAAHALTEAQVRLQAWRAAHPPETK